MNKLRLISLLVLFFLAPGFVFWPMGPTLLVGDSIVQYFPTSELLPGQNVAPWGIYGAYIETLTARIGDIVPLRPRKIIVCIGINDLQAGWSVDIIAARYQALLMRLMGQSPNDALSLRKSIIVVSAILPNMDGRISREYLAAANNKIANIAAHLGLSFIDASSAFLDDWGNVKPELFDGSVHLSYAGYQAWANFLKLHL